MNRTKYFLFLFIYQTFFLITDKVCCTIYNMYIVHCTMYKYEMKCTIPTNIPLY